jgi:hypothetical protein
MRPLPDALLLAEPKAEKERDQKMMAAVHRFDKGHTVSRLDEIIELGRYDPATVLVYRSGDLERAKRDLEDAERIAALLTVYLNGRYHVATPNGSAPLQCATPCFDYYASNACFVKPSTGYTQIDKMVRETTQFHNCRVRGRLLAGLPARDRHGGCRALIGGSGTLGRTGCGPPNPTPRVSKWER